MHGGETNTTKEMHMKFEEYVQIHGSKVDVDEAYKDMLDEVYGEVEVAGLRYSTSRTLEIVDPTAFRCGMVDFVDSMTSDNVWVEINENFYPFAEVEELRDRFEEEQPDEDEDEDEE
jgi:hypothetical protein